MATKYSSFCKIALGIALSALCQLDGAAVLADDIPANYPVANVSLKDDLSYMVGKWREEREGAILEEYWTDAISDCMVGTSRFCTPAKTKLIEIMTMTQEATGPVLRLRHFDAQLVGWKSEELPLVCPLTRMSKDGAMFESRDKGTLVRLTYKNTDVDKLTVVVEKIDASSTSTAEFHYSRIKP